MHQVQIKDTREAYTVGKIICLGQNYLDHIRELGSKVPDRAVIFCKPSSSLLPDGEQSKSLDILTTATMNLS